MQPKQKSNHTIKINLLLYSHRESVCLCVNAKAFREPLQPLWETLLRMAEVFLRSFPAVSRDLRFLPRLASDQDPLVGVAAASPGPGSPLM